jgi:hypothetical protein
LLQPLRDGIAVHRAQRDNFQDQQIQRALRKIDTRTSSFYTSYLKSGRVHSNPNFTLSKAGL